MRVGAYGRISEDTEATGLGVERQIRDCETVCQFRGWEVAHRYIDNDLSAFKRKVVRPEFEQMLLDLKNGVIDGIVVYDLDRFARQPRDLERAIEVYEERKPSPVFASVQGDINLQSADGKTMARVMVAFANKSSMDTSRRVERKHLELAYAGRSISGHRPFGWKADRISLDPRESAALRKAVSDVLAGVALSTIATRWNEAGLLTSTGKQWRSTSVRQLLVRPRLVGDKTLHGEVLEGVRGEWEPILDRDTYDRLQALLATPERRVRVPRRGARHYLLTGTIRCSVCNGLMMYGNRFKGSKGERHNYVCSNPEHAMSVSGGPVDELVSDLVLARLANEEVEVEAGPWEHEAELKATQEKVDELMKAYDDGTLSAAVVFPRVKPLEEQVADMQRSRAEWLVRTTGPAPRALSKDEWDALGVDRQRAQIEQALEAVMVKPPKTRRSNRFDPERLVPVWKRLGTTRAAGAPRG